MAGVLSKDSSPTISRFIPCLNSNLQNGPFGYASNVPIFIKPQTCAIPVDPFPELIDAPDVVSKYVHQSLGIP